MNTKSVQVVMSTYNGEKYLKEQIDSILSQEGVYVRLYIRDDGSSDRTTDILASYQEHENVKIEKGNNLGFAKSFLTALDECDEADYYAFSDQDDVWEKDKLSTAIEILEEESQSTPLLYCSALQRVDENLNPLHVQSYHGLRINLPSMLTRGRLAGCTFVFNNTLRNLVKNSSQIEMHASHDSWVLLACLACGGNVFFDKKPHILFRRYNTNTSIDGGKLKSRLKYEFRYFGKYKNNRLDTACELLNGAFLKKCGELTQLLADNKRIAVICCQNYGRLMHLRLYKNVNAEIQEEWNAIVEILKQCNYDEDVYKNVLDAVEEYFRTLVQRKKEDKLFELERFMAQVYEENGRCEAAEVAALCLANLYNSGGHRKITPDEYETIKKYLQKFPESMHIRAAFIIASEAIYSPSAEYKRVPDKIINKAKQWSEQYPKKIEFQEAYFGLLFSRLKYAQAQDMRNEQRRVYREMKTVAERANYSEYNESNQLMESVDILHRVFGY